MNKTLRRKCKVCGEWFQATYSNVVWCSPEHGTIYAIDLRTKEKVKAEAKRIKAHKEAEKVGRAEWRKRKAAVKPLKHWEDLTQRVVNDYIRERDFDLPCVSCGTYSTVQWEAGHYRSRGKASHLRYVEDNISKQCHHCNVQLSGNQQQYRISLVARIGVERVESLENNNTPHRYTIEELEAIRKHYSALRRGLVKKREAACQHNI